MTKTETPHLAPEVESSEQPGKMPLLFLKKFTTNLRLTYTRQQHGPCKLSAGEFTTIIHITGVYLSPDNKVPTSKIKDLYTTLNNNFYTPSPHSSPNSQCHHYIQERLGRNCEKRIKTSFSLFLGNL